MVILDSIGALVEEANKHLQKDQALQKALKPYIGRKLFLHIEGIDDYSISVSKQGLEFEKAKSERPESGDFYIGMPKATAERFLRIRRPRLGDLRVIKHRNVTKSELRLVKEIARRYFPVASKTS